jgi:hypothetical protein
MAENRADRDGDVARIERGGGDLVEEGLEKVVVPAVKEGDPRGRPVERARRGETGETPADDDDLGNAFDGVD